MMQTRGEYWDSDRATFEDELNAWRDRTAAPVDAPLDPIRSRVSRPQRRRSRPVSRLADLGVAPRIRRTRRETTRTIAA